eukprot:TRINITY_DN11749_c0_g1_i2.p1 TRINITY_DN11749_c0_g1~~TRINITY_DN11749_c0_g1_i2.p1  ORF type:complete len:455 (-),score=41.74 TRINITY_DN11749_c0_g1_i2:70-1434(-)
MCIRDRVSTQSTGARSRFRMQNTRLLSQTSSGYMSLPQTTTPQPTPISVVAEEPPAPAKPSKCATWRKNWSDPLSYAFEQDSFIQADRALFIGRLLVPLVLCVIPGIGIGLAFLLWTTANFDSVSISLFIALPTSILFVCSCYWTAYCVVGRIDSKQRPTRTFGYEWPWDFHCSFLGMIFLFLFFCFYGLLAPTFSGGGAVETISITIHSFFMGSALILLIYFQCKNPGIVPSSSPSTEPGAARYQACALCTQRMNAGLDGPWTDVIEDTSGQCYYSEKRRYHCSRCNRCVAGLDHHCRFLNQCVADATYAPWFAFMVMIWCAIFIQFVLTIVVFAYWIADCKDGCNSGQLENLDSIADFYSHGLYFSILSLHCVFAIGLLAFVGKLSWLHFGLLRKSRSLPFRYTMFEHLRDNACPRGMDEDKWRACLLYTSDAADEEDSVDLGGCRILKKKK